MSRKMQESGTETFIKQKKSFKDFLQNNCSYKFRKFHTKALVLGTPQHLSFLVNIAKFLRTPFYGTPLVAVSDPTTETFIRFFNTFQSDVTKLFGQ